MARSLRRSPISTLGMLISSLAAIIRTRAVAWENGDNFALGDFHEFGKFLMQRVVIESRLSNKDIALQNKKSMFVIRPQWK